jgi:hypothetical protein
MTVEEIDQEEYNDMVSSSSNGADGRSLVTGY